jgi:hypothetical protein
MLAGRIRSGRNHQRLRYLSKDDFAIQTTALQNLLDGLRLPRA